MTKAFNTLFYSKISGDLSELVDLKDYMANQIIQDEKLSERVIKEDDVAFLQKMVTKSLLNGREKQNFARGQEKSSVLETHNPFVQSNITVTPLSLNINLSTVLEADYFFKGYRTTKISVPKMKVTPDTLFEVKKITNVFPTEKFSLAFTTHENGQLIGL